MLEILETMYYISLFVWMATGVATFCGIDSKKLGWLHTLFLGYAALYSLANLISMA